MAVPLKPENVPNKSAWAGWGQVQRTFDTCSLEEVMSEQLAVQLSKEFIEKSGQDAAIDEIPKHLLEENLEMPPEGGDDTASDCLLAMMLQHEFDAEHDAVLKREQDKWNGGSKVMISYSNHRMVHPALREETDFDEDLLHVPDVKIQKDPMPSFNKQGISGKGKNVVTKHDPLLTSRRNVIKALDTFPPEFETGNGLDFDMRLPNKVFNKLKTSSNIETKRTQRHHEKREHATQLSAVDEKTKLGLYKLMNNGTIAALNGIISTGKEAIVFHADGGSLPDGTVYNELAVKVYKTTLGKFKNRCTYVKGDQRFIKDDFKRQNPRKIMRIWAKKEQINLKRMRHFKVPCPEPIMLKNHILVMSFIGEKGLPAPQLGNVDLSPEELFSAYEQVVEIMKMMHSQCNLVHADLSEFNLLWFNNTVLVIDVAQAVDSAQSKALEFLARDCRNITNFFNKNGLTNTRTWQELFNDITGFNASGEGQEFLSQIFSKPDDEATLRLDRTKKDFPFDFFFNKSCQEKLVQQDKRDDDDTEEEGDESESGSEDSDGKS